MMNRLACFVVLLTAVSTLAQGPSWQAESPLLISDFSAPQSLQLWSGVRHVATTRPSATTQPGAVTQAGSDGPAMQITFEKWQPGMSEWPLVALRYDAGRGYSTADWSHYGALAFDAWVDTKEMQQIMVELRNQAGRNGATAHPNLAAGQVNHVELQLASRFGMEMDIRNVQELVIFASKPGHAFNLTIANLRLVPGEKPPVAEFDLVYPNYRDLILHSLDVRVATTVQLKQYGLDADDVRVELQLSSGGKSARTVHAVKEEREQVSVAVARLPDGPATLTARALQISTGKELARKEWTLSKLPADKAVPLKVYVDEHNTTIVDGKPFFPLGWYDSPDEKHLEEIAGGPFNTLLDYGANQKDKKWMLHYLDQVQAKGMKFIYCLNDVYPTAKYFEGKSWEGVSGNDAIRDAVVKAYREHPAVLAWYLNDELPRALAPNLTEYYHAVRSADPQHPCYIVLCDMHEIQWFPHTTDIFGVDPYPVPRDPVTMVSTWMDAADKAVSGHKPTWLVPQAFAWYQYNPEGSNRARKPTADELKTGRAPTYDEARCMTWLALTHGAKGIIYYCYYDLRVLPNYAELWAGYKKMAAEVKEFSPVLLAPDDLGPAKFTPADAPIHTKLKRHDGKLYLMAVNAGDKACTATFTLDVDMPPQVPAIFENRTVPAEGKTLAADFKPFEARVFEMPAGK
jgi:hypothetical protein